MITDLVKIELIKDFFSMIGTLLSGVIVLLLAKANRTAGDAVRAAEVVKEDLKRSSGKTIGLLTDTSHHIDNVLTAVQENGHTIGDQLSSINGTTSKTHELVNSAMEQQLRITALALRRIAEITKDSYDIAAADAAESLLKAQIKKLTGLEEI